jgi:hypothetical protein
MERADDDRVQVGLVQVEPARLAQPPRPRLPESGRDCDDSSARLVSDDLELVSLAHGRLVDVAGEDQVCACVHERTKDMVAPRDGTLVRRTPRCSDEVVVEDCNAERSLLRSGKPPSSAVELSPAQRASLMAEGPSRIEADGVEPGRRDGRLGRLPDPLELGPWTNEPHRRVGEVVVSRNREDRRSERPEQLSRPLELLPAATMREIARCDDDLRLQTLHEPYERLLDFPLLMCTHVKIGNVEEPGIHDRTRL